MRILTAIRFDEELKSALLSDAERLRPYLLKGTVTEKDQLFLPLVSVGETDQTAPIKEIMDRIQGTAFEFGVGGFGIFKRPVGDLIWEGAEQHPDLLSLYRQLSLGFSAKGYRVDKGNFQPIITLVREAALSPSFNKAAFTASVPFRTAYADKVSLMRWDRENGKNLYSEIYSVRLNG